MTVVAAPVVAAPDVAAPGVAAPAVSAPVVDAPACAPRVALVFPYASAAIPEAAAELLAPVIAHASAHVDATVLVDGHADPSGTELDNLVLSKRRASGIARLLDRAGIAKQRLVVRAFGAYVPMPGEGAELRRVHVSFADDPCRKESP
ncbi:MAG: OmpA family protein [Kofleriaceae bacterium]